MASLDEILKGRKRITQNQQQVSSGIDSTTTNVGNGYNQNNVTSNNNFTTHTDSTNTAVRRQLVLANIKPLYNQQSPTYTSRIQTPNHTYTDEDVEKGLISEEGKEIVNAHTLINNRAEVEERGCIIIPLEYENLQVIQLYKPRYRNVGDKDHFYYFDIEDSNFKEGTDKLKKVKEYNERILKNGEVELDKLALLISDDADDTDDTQYVDLEIIDKADRSIYNTVTGYGKRSMNPKVILSYKPRNVEETLEKYIDFCENKKKKYSNKKGLDEVFQIGIQNALDKVDANGNYVHPKYKEYEKNYLTALKNTALLSNKYTSGINLNKYEEESFYLNREYLLLNRELMEKYRDAVYKGLKNKYKTDETFYAKINQDENILSKEDVKEINYYDLLINRAKLELYRIRLNKAGLSNRLREGLNIIENLRFKKIKIDNKEYTGDAIFDFLYRVDKKLKSYGNDSVKINNYLNEKVEGTKYTVLLLYNKFDIITNKYWDAHPRKSRDVASQLLGESHDKNWIKINGKYVDSAILKDALKNKKSVLIGGKSGKVYTPELIKDLLLTKEERQTKFTWLTDATKDMLTSYLFDKNGSTSNLKYRGMFNRTTEAKQIRARDIPIVGHINEFGDVIRQGLFNARTLLYGSGELGRYIGDFNATLGGGIYDIATAIVPKQYYLYESEADKALKYGKNDSGLTQYDVKRILSFGDIANPRNQKYYRDSNGIYQKKKKWSKDEALMLENQYNSPKGEIYTVGNYALQVAPFVKKIGKVMMPFFIYNLAKEAKENFSNGDYGKGAANALMAGYFAKHYTKGLARKYYYEPRANKEAEIRYDNLVAEATRYEKEAQDKLGVAEQELNSYKLSENYKKAGENDYVQLKSKLDKLTAEYENSKSDNTTDGKKATSNFKKEIDKIKNSEEYKTSKKAYVYENLENAVRLRDLNAHTIEVKTELLKNETNDAARSVLLKEINLLRAENKKLLKDIDEATEFGEKLDLLTVKSPEIQFLPKKYLDLIIERQYDNAQYDYAKSKIEHPMPDPASRVATEHDFKTLMAPEWFLRGETYARRAAVNARRGLGISFGKQMAKTDAYVKELHEQYEALKLNVNNAKEKYDATKSQEDYNSWQSEISKLDDIKTNIKKQESIDRINPEDVYTSEEGVLSYFGDRFFRGRNNPKNPILMEIGNKSLLLDLISNMLKEGIDIPTEKIQGAKHAYKEYNKSKEKLEKLLAKKLDNKYYEKNKELLDEKIDQARKDLEIKKTAVERIETEFNKLEADMNKNLDKVALDRFNEEVDKILDLDKYEPLRKEKELFSNRKELLEKALENAKTEAEQARNDYKANYEREYREEEIKRYKQENGIPDTKSISEYIDDLKNSGADKEKINEAKKILRLEDKNTAEDNYLNASDDLLDTYNRDWKNMSDSELLNLQEQFRVHKDLTPENEQSVRDGYDKQIKAINDAIKLRKRAKKAKESNSYAKRKEADQKTYGDVDYRKKEYEKKINLLNKAQKEYDDFIKKNGKNGENLGIEKLRAKIEEIKSEWGLSGEEHTSLKDKRRKLVLDKIALHRERVKTRLDLDRDDLYRKEEYDKVLSDIDKATKKIEKNKEAIKTCKQLIEYSKEVIEKTKNKQLNGLGDYNVNESIIKKSEGEIRNFEGNIRMLEKENIDLHDLVQKSREYQVQIKSEYNDLKTDIKSILNRIETLEKDPEAKPDDTTIEEYYDDLNSRIDDLNSKIEELKNLPKTKKMFMSEEELADVKSLIKQYEEQLKEVKEIFVDLDNITNKDIINQLRLVLKDFEKDMSFFDEIKNKEFAIEDKAFEKEMLQAIKEIERFYDYGELNLKNISEYIYNGKKGKEPLSIQNKIDKFYEDNNIEEIKVDEKTGKKTVELQDGTTESIGKYPELQEMLSEQEIRLEILGKIGEILKIYDIREGNGPKSKYVANLMKAVELESKGIMRRLVGKKRLSGIAYYNPEIINLRGKVMSKQNLAEGKFFDKEWRDNASSNNGLAKGFVSTILDKIKPKETFDWAASKYLNWRKGRNSVNNNLSNSNTANP